jgi:hypothetical protein
LKSTMTDIRKFFKQIPKTNNKVIEIYLHVNIYSFLFLA